MNATTPARPTSPVPANTPESCFTDIEQQTARSLISAKDYPKAYDFCLPFAQKGNAEAKYLLGITYKRALESNQFSHLFFVTGMISWLHAASKQGHLKATCELGMYYFNQRDYKNARYYFNQFNRFNLNSSDLSPTNPYQTAPLDESERARVNCCLGTMYYSGLGVAEDKEKALAHYTTSVAQGNVHAKYLLGCAGLLDPEKTNEGLALLKEAAAERHAQANNILGEYYESLEDFNTAEGYYRLAAELMTPDTLAHDAHSDIRQPARTGSSPKCPLPLPQSYLNVLTKSRKF